MRQESKQKLTKYCTLVFIRAYGYFWKDLNLQTVGELDNANLILGFDYFLMPLIEDFENSVFYIIFSKLSFNVSTQGIKIRIRHNHLLK